MPMAESKRNKDMNNLKCTLKTKETNKEERGNHKQGSKEISRKSDILFRIIFVLDED